MTLTRAISQDLGIPRYRRFCTWDHGPWRKYQNVSRLCDGGARVCCRVLQGGGEESSVGNLTTLVIHGGVLGGILYGVVSSTWKPRSLDAYEEHRREYRVGIVEREDGFETAVRWSVMSILSCVPYVNYMAWVFAALDSSSLSMLEGSNNGNRGSHYWTLAAVYALPYLVDWFHIDTFTLISLSIGVMHVQIERGLYYGDLNSWFGSTVQSLVDKLSRGSSSSTSSGTFESLDIDEGILRDLEDFDKRLDAALHSSDIKSMDGSE